MMVTVSGLKGSGKSTLAKEIAGHLICLGVKVRLVDVGHEVLLDHIQPTQVLPSQHGRRRPLACLVEVVE